MKNLSFFVVRCLRQLARDWRAGELRLLALAVCLAVAALTAVSFFSDRLQRGLARDARQFLGGDVVLVSDQALPDDFSNQAVAQGLQVARTMSFPSMARAPDERGAASRLVAIKAVGEGYPLRGALRLSPGQGLAEETRAQGPQPGYVWVDPGVLEALSLQVGDRLLLGDASFSIEKIIQNEPDRGAGFLNFSPRVMMNLSDLPATQLIQPASRVRYRLAVASPAKNDQLAKSYQAWAQAEIERQQLRNVQVEVFDTGRPEMRQTLDRASQFLNLVALLAALLAAVAVAIASRDFALRHLDDCAILRVLGQSHRRIAAQYAIEFGLVGAASSALGVLLGFVIHDVFVVLLAALLTTQLPEPGLWPAAFGMGVGLTLLAGFGLPPVVQLARVPALRVIRRELGRPKAASLMVLLAALCSFVTLLWVVANDTLLAGVAIGGVVMALLGFALCAWLALMLLRRLVQKARAPRWLLLATRQMAARPAFTILQVCALSLGLLALVLLVLLRTDLIQSWQQATPPDAPNRFVINIQPDQTQAFQAHLQQAGITQFDWYPMVRARLLAVNQRPVSADQYSSERAKSLVEREFNLSYSAQLPSGNQVLAGAWQAEEPGAWSVEEGLAKALGLNYGDTLRFDMASQIIEGKITSLRKVNWSSMRVNFFVMLPVSDWPQATPSYIAAFRAPALPGFDNQLSRAFPNITNVDTSASVAQIQSVLGQVIRAVEFLFGFTLAAGLLVLFATVTASREARVREFAVMRALGAGAGLLAQVQRTELLGVGALAGVLASTAAMIIGWALARWVFDFVWAPSPWVPLLGALGGAVLALGAGWWGLREVLRRPVVETLRQAAHD